MPRVNIYLPNDVYELTSQWRGSANLSEICVRAIRDEFEAADTHRAPLRLIEAMAAPTPLERALADKFALAEVIIIQAPNDAAQAREQLGLAAASYLDRMISDGACIGLAGGRQIWCMVRALRPRRVRATVTAIGLGYADPKLLHAHPNTLVTLAWLAYSPRSEAHVVGATGGKLWIDDLPTREHPTYFIFGSCAQFDPTSPFAQLLGQDAVNQLIARTAFADFAYAFMDENGRPINVNLQEPQTIAPAGALQGLSKRADARVVLVAAGEAKLRPINLTLSSQLCNMLITDERTARALVGE